MQVEKCQKTKNGVSIYSYKNPALNGFYISLFVKAGSMYESEELSGITHFLEHVAVRNINARRGGALYPTLDKHGLEFNASTYSEMVQFYISGASASFSVGAGIITELLSPLALSRDDVDTERQRIRAEIRESDERTSLVSFSGKRVFAGTPLSRSIVGTGKSIGKITRARLEEYRKSQFTSENIFFYVTGRFDEKNIDELAKLVEVYEISHGRANENIAQKPAAFGKRENEVYIKNSDFTMARFTFDIDMTKVGMCHSDLIYDILLSGYSSDFFMELSEKRGLCYDLTGNVERYKNIGTLSFSYEVKGEKLYDAVGRTVDCLRQLKEKILPEEKCMKAGYVSNAYMLYDDIRELNFTFSYDNHIMGLGYSSIEDRIEAYKKVTPEELRESAREIFKRENLTLCIKANRKKVDTERLKAIISEL